MNDQTDSQLLNAWAKTRSEPAFAELVRRHVDLVHSAALRMVSDSHLAEDVTQRVFVALAKSAAQIADCRVLAGWLHRTAQNIAAETVRTDVRRRAREQEAVAMNQLLATESDAPWEHIAPHLDAALGELTDPDRDAVLLRYFERKTAREMAQILGTSEDAAQRRVSRAVERLREFFAKRGVTVGASGLVVVISANAVQAAPVGLAVTISTAAALAGTTIAATATATAIKTIAMTTLQKTVVGTALAVAVCTGIYEARQASQLRKENQTLQQQRTALTEQIQQLAGEQYDAKQQITALRTEMAKSNRNSSELLKLRGEVARLRAEVRESPAASVALLKQKLERMPERKIPELEFLTEKGWADAAWEADLSNEDGVREALSKLREVAVNKFLNEMMKTAMKKYLAAHDGILPADLYQLKPYFDVPVTDAMLQRYELLQSGKPDNRADLVKLVKYADEEYDSRHTISINGASQSIFNHVEDAVKNAAKDFAKNNNGRQPTDPSQITAYLKKPIDTATIQKYFNRLSKKLELGL